MVAASLTPVSDTGSIDVARLKSHLDWLFAAGCSFVSPFGSTGEGASFSVREKRAALAALQQAGAPMDRLIPASMSPALDDAVATIAAAADLGCRAVLIAPPFYYGAASQDGIAAFFEASANRFGGTFPLDVVLYHIPAMTKVGYGVELVQRLIARHGRRLVGIKDSTGDRAHTLMLAQTFPELRIFTGDDRVLPDLLAAGGAGMIGGLPNVNAVELCRFFADPTGPEAQGLRDRAAQRIVAVDEHGGIIALKAVKAQISGDAAWLRPLEPLLPLPAAGIAALLDSFRRSQFHFPGEEV
ncbi:dihydrodipicolinate synthase family protein [Devosia sp. A16]|uniref:dihydrodipicolinate synthase family protein n=1 Tax=Devosia sp. A16 TaxID=1736675 RepID=UPI0009E688F9